MLTEELNSPDGWSVVRGNVAKADLHNNQRVRRKEPVGKRAHWSSPKRLPYTILVPYQNLFPPDGPSERGKRGTRACHGWCSFVM